MAVADLRDDATFLRALVLMLMFKGYRLEDVPELAEQVFMAVRAKSVG